MVGIRSFPIGFRPIFRCKLAVSFREGSHCLVHQLLFTTHSWGFPPSQPAQLRDKGSSKPNSRPGAPKTRPAMGKVGGKVWFPPHPELHLSLKSLKPKKKGEEVSFSREKKIWRWFLFGIPVAFLMCLLYFFWKVGVEIYRVIRITSLDWTLPIQAC